MQKKPPRNFSFDRMSRKNSNASLNGVHEGPERAASATTTKKRNESGERRDRWKKIRIFSQGPRVTSKSPTTGAQSGATSPTPPTMADFLSRESELLGGQFSAESSSFTGPSGADDIDFDRAASAFPDISLDGSGDIPTPAPVASSNLSNGLDFGDFSDPVRERVQDVKVTGDDEIERFEDQFPDIGGVSEVISPITPQQPTFGAAPPFAPRPQPSAFSSTPILQQPLPDEEEPDVVKAWREKQSADIKARDEASQARRQETIAKAERSIDQFYEEYNAKKERNIKENKQQEAEYLASFSDSLSVGTTWSRICDYIDLQNSQSKTLARTGAGTTDLSRFKEVLLRLKREGEAAPGAAGY